MNNAPIELTTLPHSDAVNVEPYLLRGHTRMEPNAWAAKEANFRLPTIRTYKSDDGHRFGWEVKVNDHQPHTVQAFPEVLLFDSTKPWSDLPTNPLGMLPRRIRELKEMVVGFNLRWDATGSANIAIETWLTREKNGKGNDAIAAEVMIWLDRRGSIQPAGRKVVALNGWDLWMSSGFAGEGGPPWPYFAFVPTSGAVLDDVIDVRPFLAFLANRGSITDDLWVRTCELGTEIIDDELWLYCDRLDGRMS